jgi:DNA polymerase III alpha subunit
MATELEQIQALMNEFRRPCPDTAEYQDRLAEEFGIIIQQRFTDYFLKIRWKVSWNTVPGIHLDSCRAWV